MSIFLVFYIFSLLLNSLNLFGEDKLSLFAYARKSRVTKLITPLKLAQPAKVIESLAERGLTNSTYTSAKSILDNCQTSSLLSQKQYSNKLLGFVTPWNPSGYDIAVDYKAKFDYVVPAWYTITFVICFIC